MEKLPFCLFRIPKQGGRVIWEITNSCNYACSYCIFSSDYQKHPDELSTTQIFETIDALKAYGFSHLKITGGEPFIRPDLLEILEHAHAQNFELDISTNASLITEKIAKKLKAINLPMIHVSLDGHTQEIQESVRGNHTYSRTLYGIHHLVEQGLYVRIGALLFQQSESHIEAMIQKSIELGAKEIIFSKMEPVGRMRGNNKIITQTPIPEFVERLDTLKSKYKTNIIVNYSFVQESTVIDKKGRCPGGKKFLYISHQGNVSPCTWISEHFPHYVSKKTLQTHSLINIMGTPEMQKYLELTEDLAQKRNGSCPAKALTLQLQKTPKFSENSPIYAFTTENLDGYFSHLNIKDKTILSVGGSGDHLINAYLYGAEKVMCFDSNRLAYFYAELKLKALKNLSFIDFKKFLLRNPEKNNQTFSFETYKSLKTELSPLTRHFFDQLYEQFNNDGHAIRESKFFNNRHDSAERKIKTNPYLHSEKNYKKAQKTLQDKPLLWKTIPLQELCLNKILFMGNQKFDLILLSNIADYSDKIIHTQNYLEDFRNQIITPLTQHLKSKGKLVFAYLYQADNRPHKGLYHNLIDNPLERRKTFQFQHYDYREHRFPSVINGEDCIAYLKNSNE
jgi:MoaA/NifB/PqqE/SkfB family radical SAM enzyme